MDPTWEEIRAALLARPGRPAAETLPSRAAVALILRDGPGGMEVLFIRRAEHPQDPWSGQMAFPGGRAEAADLDLLRTAVRETLEEIGLDLDRSAEFLGALDEIRAMARMRPMDLTITPHVFRLHEAVDAAAGAEVTSVHWVPLAPLLGPGLRSTMEYEHQGVSLQFPCLRFEELVIWGLTYRMFLSFQERFARPDPRPATGA